MATKTCKRGIRLEGRHVPERAPTPKPAMNRPMVIWTIEKVVAVWMATPMVNIPDQSRMDPRRPKRSEVKACPSAPLYRILNLSTSFR